jgi:hypothetical protein
MPPRNELCPNNQTNRKSEGKVLCKVGHVPCEGHNYAKFRRDLARGRRNMLSGGSSAHTPTPTIVKHS